ncbi:MAG: hypothetical protein COT14_01225 [Candidatus Diapherotrites archaeon CG08_land_8_20_14_0_20_30_16]|nr:MAG: hypothetical protein COT14_01225 [Candidatus Diapherotrites archaeon CG08_land_8_20_14_0_20_30_16]
MANYITTSRKPSTRVRALAKQLSFLFDAEYITRGKTSISGLIADARYNGVRFVLIITEKDGNPRQLLVMEVNNKIWEWKEAYFIKILVTKSEISDTQNIRIKDFKLESKNIALLNLLKFLDVEENEDSEFVVKDIKNGLSIYWGKKEIGPAFDLSFTH